MYKSGITIGALLLCANSAMAQEWPNEKLRYANIMPESFITSETDQFLVDEIEKRTNGAVKIEIFHGGTLGGPGEMIELIGSGAVEIGNFPISYFFSQFPVASLNDSLPIIFDTAEQSAMLARESMETLEEPRAELLDANLRSFMYRGLPQYRIVCTKPVETLEDFNGLKIRTYGTFHPLLFQTFGAVPVNMELGETYEGLQRGTVDCVYLNYLTASLYKLHEVAKYTSDAEFGATPLFLNYVNNDVWESWSPEFKELFSEVVAEAEQKAHNEINAAEEEGLQTLLDNGVELIPFKDQEKMVAEAPDFLELWVDKVAEVGKGDAARKHADFIHKRLDELRAQ
jgi:TRAP-type transport system periplasmic protein